MEDKFLNDSTYLSIREMAKINNISTRTLRYYHEIGLFVPEHIDKKTGYRYYTSQQLPHIKIIVEMRELGLSLNEIKIILNSKDTTILVALLSEKIDSFEKQILDLRNSRNLMINWLNSCNYLKDLPKLDSIFIEYIPERTANIFAIDEYDFLETYTDGSPWKKTLQEINNIFHKQNSSLKHFHQVGCMISKESLESRDLICSGAFIITEDTSNYEAISDIHKCKIPQGTYACMFRKYIAMDNKSESIGLQALLDYISKNNFKINGPYYGEIVAKTSIFDHNDYNILVKLQIPIKITGLY